MSEHDQQEVLFQPEAFPVVRCNKLSSTPATDDAQMPTLITHLTANAWSCVPQPSERVQSLRR